VTTTAAPTIGALLDGFTPGPIRGPYPS
jgi:hypothetical protein